MLSLNEHAHTVFSYCLSSSDILDENLLVDAAEYTAMAIGRHAYRLQMKRSEIVAWVKTYYSSVFSVPDFPYAMPEILWRILQAWRAQKEVMTSKKEITEAFPDYLRLHALFVKEDKDDDSGRICTRSFQPIIKQCKRPVRGDIDENK